MKTAVQIYTVRNTLLSDPKAHLTEIKNMGYEGVELCNFGGDSVNMLCEIMNEVGLEVFSIHTGIDEILAEGEALLERYAKLGCKYMPIGWLPGDRLAGGPLFDETLEVIRKFAESAKKYGIKVLYHNHEFDFELVGIEHKLDILYKELPDDVLLCEIDTCWVYTGGEDPLDYLKKYAGRCPVLHLKDCVKEGGRKGYRALGEGVLDFEPIIMEAEAQNIEWLCVEQDEPSPDKSPMECLRMSMDYLKTIL